MNATQESESGASGYWKDEVEARQTSFYSRWKAFASRTTLHGISYIFDSSLPILRRVIWLIFLCASSSAFLYLVTISTGKFISLPMKTVITQEEPPNGLKFPAVTICNLNKFMKSKIDMADDEKSFKKLGLNISGCDEIREVRGNLTCGQALLCTYFLYAPALVKGCDETIRQNVNDVLNGSSNRLFSEEKFLTSYGHDMAGMYMDYCRYTSQLSCSDKDFVPTITPDGLCFTFNSGYNNTPVLNSFFEGPELGLNILLNVQTNESTLTDFSSGLKVIVHDQDTYVNRRSGFNIAPGTHSSVAVRLRKVSITQRVPKYKSIQDSHTAVLSLKFQTR